jgi:hypothetical protein
MQIRASEKSKIVNLKSKMFFCRFFWWGTKQFVILRPIYQPTKK